MTLHTELSPVSDLHDEAAEACRVRLVREIPLTRGYVALVDDADYELVCPYSWHVIYQCVNVVKLYAKTDIRVDGRRTSLRMHRLILGATRGGQVDHKDGNGLNNQRHNLRLATSGQNNCNRNPYTGKRFKGITWRARAGKWHSQIKLHRQCRHIGVFDSQEEAARAYDAAAKELFGEFARLNFPEKEQDDNHVGQGHSERPV